MRFLDLIADYKRPVRESLAEPDHVTPPEADTVVHTGTSAYGGTECWIDPEDEETIEAAISPAGAVSGAPKQDQPLQRAANVGGDIVGIGAGGAARGR